VSSIDRAADAATAGDAEALADLTRRDDDPRRDQPIPAGEVGL